MFKKLFAVLAAAFAAFGIVQFFRHRAHAGSRFDTEAQATA